MLKALTTCLLLDLEVPSKVAKFKSAYNSLIKLLFIFKTINCPFTVDISCIWPQMHPWSS